MVKTMDCGIVVSEFEPPVVLLRSLSDKYPWEKYEPLFLPAMGKIVPLMLFWNDFFGIK